VACAIRSKPTENIPDRSALDSGYYIDVEDEIASRRCPTCNRWSDEFEFYAGRSVMAKFATRGKIRTALVHREHLVDLRESAQVLNVREAA
jgi:hypothetical protein